jgi:hypothetical protein
MYTPYTDDSIAHLLIANNSIHMVNSTFAANPNGHNEYEDLTEIVEITDIDKTQNIYIEDPIERNHYCYIPENQIGSNNDASDAVATSRLDASPKSTTQTTIVVINSTSEDYAVPSNAPITH